MRRAIISLVLLFFATASLAQPVTTQWDISNSRAQCAANVPLVGAGAGASPACWPAALGSIAAVVPGTGVNAALALNVGGSGAPVLFDGLGGTPSAIDLTHGTNLPVSTGVGGLASGVAAFLAAPSSANLRAAMTDESGTGALIFAGGNVGAATATSINGNVITTGTGTLTLGAGKTLTVSNSVTFTAASDGLTVNFPTSDTVVMLGGAQTITGGKTFPAGTLILSGTGGASQVLKQVSSGAAVTVGQLAFTDISGSIAAAQQPAGQYPGTTTNDNATAGNVGEYNATAVSAVNNANATVTMTIAAPAVVTWTAHGFCYSGATGCGTAAVATAIKFTTTGALPTGITASTTYYLKAIDANTFNVSTSCANALAGVFITTTGSQSGVQTGDIRINLSTGTGAAQDVACIAVPAGDHDVGGQMLKGAGASTTVTYYGGSLSLVSNTKDTTFGRRLSFQYGGLALGASEFTVFDFAPTRFSFTSPTNVYLVSDDIFATSTLIGSGWMRERRAR